VRFLLDENVSPSLARRLAAKGIDAWHTRDRDLRARRMPFCGGGSGSHEPMGPDRGSGA
jgi:hypothetical protein